MYINKCGRSQNNNVQTTSEWGGESAENEAVFHWLLRGFVTESIKSAASVFTARLKRKKRHGALCHCGHMNCWEGHERGKTSETSLTIHTIRLIHHIQYLTRWVSVCLTLKSLHADRPNGPTEALPWLRKQLTDKGSRICIIFRQSPVQEGSERLTSDGKKRFHVLKVRKKFKFIRKLSKMGTA